MDMCTNRINGDDDDDEQFDVRNDEHDDYYEFDNCHISI
jgi:hypothetical protein